MLKTTIVQVQPDTAALCSLEKGRSWSDGVELKPSTNFSLNVIRRCEKELAREQFCHYVIQCPLLQDHQNL